MAGPASPLSVFLIEHSRCGIHSNDGSHDWIMFTCDANYSHYTLSAICDNDSVIWCLVSLFVMHWKLMSSHDMPKWSCIGRDEYLQQTDRLSLTCLHLASIVNKNLWTCGISYVWRLPGKISPCLRHRSSLSGVAHSLILGPPHSRSTDNKDDRSLIHNLKMCSVACSCALSSDWKSVR